LPLAKLGGRPRAHGNRIRCQWRRGNVGASRGARVYSRVNAGRSDNCCTRAPVVHPPYTRMCAFVMCALIHLSIYVRDTPQLSTDTRVCTAHAQVNAHVHIHPATTRSRLGTRGVTPRTLLHHCPHTCHSPVMQFRAAQVLLSI
jgi:hypothetical protein